MLCCCVYTEDMSEGEEDVRDVAPAAADEEQFQAAFEVCLSLSKSLSLCTVIHCGAFE